MPAPVSIVIPAHNQLDCCRQCIESIQAHTNYPHKLILVDNGSTDGVSEYFDSVPNAVVVHSETNRGFPAGVNLGLAHAVGHVLLLNSDTIVPSQWLERLAHALESSPRIGLVGPMSNCVSGPQFLPGLEFTTLDQINAFADARATEFRGRLLDVERIVGFCMLIRDAAFQSVGLLDESFGVGNFEDDDYCLRVRKAGYRVCIAEDCFVFHYGSRTFSAMGFDNARFGELIAANEAAFNRKWGTDSDAPRATRVAENLLAEARGLETSGKHVAAIARIKDAIAIAPYYAPAYFQLGCVLLGLGHKPQAIEQFRRVLRLEPSHAESLAHLSALDPEPETKIQNPG
ncbi:MAG: glycosyltransferase [Candidatus Hydrogenedentes bacterium]|nr:glycosyltransferase [Candidatus Hydrogenedentota bacterium]